MKILSARIVATAAGPEGYPAGALPEVAFLGRSNVGKSSLLNRLVGRKALAYTSRTPGKTRLVYWYRVSRPGGERWLVDLPGYGYAKVSKQERRGWQRLVELCCVHAATCYDLPGRDGIRDGNRADLVLVRPTRFARSAVHTRARRNPYRHLTFDWEVAATLVGGEVAFANGAFPDHHGATGVHP